MVELKTLWTYLQARREVARNDEEGFTTVEWLVIVVGVVAMAILAVAAVRAFFSEKKGEIGTT